MSRAIVTLRPPGSLPSQATLKNLGKTEICQCGAINRRQAWCHFFKEIIIFFFVLNFKIFFYKFPTIVSLPNFIPNSTSQFHSINYIQYFLLCSFWQIFRKFIVFNSHSIKFRIIQLISFSISRSVNLEANWLFDTEHNEEFDRWQSTP